MGEESLYNQK